MSSLEDRQKIEDDPNLSYRSDVYKDRVGKFLGKLRAGTIDTNTPSTSELRDAQRISKNSKKKEHNSLEKQARKSATRLMSYENFCNLMD